LRKRPYARDASPGGGRRDFGGVLHLQREVAQVWRAEGAFAIAIKVVAAAYAGRHERRKPILVEPLEAGRYLVLDGNSTVSVAIAAGWPTIPCLVQCDGAKKQPPWPGAIRTFPSSCSRMAEFSSRS
jgi:hypothetical protein